MEQVNINDKLALFGEYYSPKIISRFNDYHIKLAKLKGEFVWHRHADTDEVFLILEGRLNIEFRDRTVVLNRGEILVVPKNVEHRPSAGEECSVMIIEPAGTINTGDNSKGTSGEWI